VVHSHLRWDFVWQRPQQLLSRMAGTARVVFVEEPVFADDVAEEAGQLVVTEPCAGVTRVVPRLGRALCGSYDAAIAAVHALLDRERESGGVLGEADTRPVVQWFYTPMPVPEMLGALDESAVVYDCMDELAKFRFAPPDISRRERLLLARADVVFTGGRRLYESRSRYHDNVHFFGCGVDAAHFAGARDVAAVPPDDVAHITGPVLGYVGVVDERLDYELIRALAAARDDWSLAMVGPVVKVDPAELPTAHNIHWLGQRNYADLPHYLRRYDVCLMPFALNEATEYINPTKTLEYMAAGKPIVSTPVADVVRNFTPVVQIAHTPAAFVAACVRGVTTPDPALIARGIERAAASSWDRIVCRMHALITDAIAENDAQAESEPVPAAAASSWLAGGADGVTSGVAGLERTPRADTVLADALVDDTMDRG